MKKDEKKVKAEGIPVETSLIEGNTRARENCRHVVSSPKRVYCGKLREAPNHIESCSHFELEPLEYKLYRRM